MSVGILHCKGVVSSTEAYCVPRGLALQGCCFHVLRLIVSVGIFHCKGAVLSTKTSKTYCVCRNSALQGCCFKYGGLLCP